MHKGGWELVLNRDLGESICVTDARGCERPKQKEVDRLKQSQCDSREEGQANK